MDPSRYIERVSLVSGEPLDTPIDPAELLVHQHRDYHALDNQARRILSRIVAATSEPGRARARMRRARRFAHRTAEVLARVTPKADADAIGRALFGLTRREHYFRYRPTIPPGAEQKLDRLRDLAGQRLAAARQGERLRLRVLLTGGTGFVGKEILAQTAHDPDVEELWVLIRPRQGRGAEERGADLLHELGLTGGGTDNGAAARFRFVAGDVTQPDLDIAPAIMEELASRVTHLIHCAASVAFDDPYPASFEANVTGTLHALRFSRRLVRHPSSPFIAHLAIETAYIHGRRHGPPAREDQLVFPRNYYNNYYELTKAMASLESHRFMFEEGVPVVQLCPAIVIGHEHTGNNRGDTKVVNAPVNLFGRAHEALRSKQGGLLTRSQVAALAWVATIFPAHKKAELNLIPVDWVGRGIVAALKRPQSVGERIHLATNRRITSVRMTETVRDELGTHVKLAEPTLHRGVIFPVLNRVLQQVKQERLARSLGRLAEVFGGYGESYQPVHEVAKDVTLLGLPEERPDTERAFRMLCRHNRWVQQFGKVRDSAEIARRERTWSTFLDALERHTGRPPADLEAGVFRRALEACIDRERFTFDAEALAAWDVNTAIAAAAAERTSSQHRRSLERTGLAVAFTGVAAGLTLAALRRRKARRARRDAADQHAEAAKSEED